jgi:hypothetical protein
MRGLLIGALVMVAAAAAGRAQQPIEIDRTLRRVYDTAIMASDVREARLLKLVPEAGAGDEAVQRALENRLLILHEMARAQPIDPGRDLVADRRQRWTSSWPAGTDLPALMTKCGTTQEALDGWFRTDLQITRFLTERFPQNDAARDAKINDWIADLRKRANLGK